MPAGAAEDEPTRRAQAVGGVGAAGGGAAGAAGFTGCLANTIVVGSGSSAGGGGAAGRAVAGAGRGAGGGGLVRGAAAASGWIRTVAWGTRTVTFTGADSGPAAGAPMPSAASSAAVSLSP